MLRALAAAFALIAVLCMVFATAGMVTGRQSARAGTLIRLAAVVCFVIAVALNVAAH
jgi:membrane-anchored protein YejM (alkaline phosphatase superfamily)